MDNQTVKLTEEKPMESEKTNLEEERKMNNQPEKVTEKKVDSELRVVTNEVKEREEKEKQTPVLNNLAGTTGVNQFGYTPRLKWSDRPTEVRQDDALNYLLEGTSKILTTLGINSNEEWSEEVRKYLYDDLGRKVKHMEEKIRIIQRKPITAKELEEIQQKLKENPVKSIKVIPATEELAKFQIIKEDTGAVLFTENAETTMRILEGMSKMQ